jgi:hypothetical protein
VEAFLRRPSKLDCGAAVALIFALGCSHPATKEDLVERFEEHRAQFERLVEMLREDETIRLLMEDYELSDPLIEERRLAEYRRIMRQSGVRTLTPERDATPFAVSFQFSDSLDETTLLEIALR